MTPDSTLRAERRFRDAFDRLKRGSPIYLKKGTPVSQNNVAREAGTCPSALRASRYPNLVSEIQKWIEEHEDDNSQLSPRQKVLAVRRRNKTLGERITELQAQRDDALGKLLSAEARIWELIVENERLSAQLPPSNVTPLRR